MTDYSVGHPLRKQPLQKINHINNRTNTPNVLLEEPVKTGPRKVEIQKDESWIYRIATGRITLVVGITMTMKTTLVRHFILKAFEENPHRWGRIMVLAPGQADKSGNGEVTGDYAWLERWAPGSVISDNISVRNIGDLIADQEQKKKRGCMTPTLLIMDDVFGTMEKLNTCNEMKILVARARHLGITCIVVCHSIIQVAPAVRGAASAIYMSVCGNGDQKIIHELGHDLGSKWDFMGNPNSICSQYLKPGTFIRIGRDAGDPAIKILTDLPYVEPCINRVVN